MAHIARLLNQDINTVSSYSDYIIALKHALKKLKLQNDFLLETKDYLPNIEIQVKYPFNDFRLHSTDCVIDSDFGSLRLVTITFDQKKFPQLIITPKESQIRYITNIMHNAVYNQSISKFYGVFELQKNGNVHFHFLTYFYGQQELRFIECIKPYFTNDPRNKYCLDLRSVPNPSGLIDTYFNKEPYGFLEYNFKRKKVIYDLDL